MHSYRIYAIVIALALVGFVFAATSELASAQSPYGNGNGPGNNNPNMNGAMNNGMMNSMMLNNSMLLHGQIVNVQTNSSGMPTYIESGIFVIRVNPNGNSTDHAQLFARFDMIKPDGTNGHMHMIYGFKMSNMTTEQNGTVVVASGTATVTLAGSPVKDVPLTIKVFNHKVVGFWVGPDKINGHFGTNAMYGLLSKPSRGIMNEMGQMHSMMH